MNLSHIAGMKTIVLGLILSGFVGSTFATDKAELDNRIRSLTTKFLVLQSKPDKRIPAEHLKKARGIILMDRTKAGFLFAYEGGGGVAMVRNAAGAWSPVSFVGATDASLGFQVGGEQTFYAILLMDTNATRLLTEPTFEFAGEARGTAGDATAVESGKMTVPSPPVLVYDDRKGLYGGAAIKGGAISPDNQGNRIYYGEAVTIQDVLFDKKVQRSEAATQLADKLNEQTAKPAD
jgi:lipid-binding SYLF domain-containing protein